MSRLLMLCVGLLLVLAQPLRVSAADTKPDLTKATTSALAAAENQLSAARTRIAEEQTTLLKDMQAALTAANAARDRLVNAERDAKVANDDLAKRTREQERELTLIRQLADRAVVAARLGEDKDRALQGQLPLERLDTAPPVSTHVSPPCPLVSRCVSATKPSSPATVAR